ERSRSGSVMSQGAAALLLESEAGAAARGAEPLVELAGFVAASDAHHPTNPHPDRRGAAAAVPEAPAHSFLGPAVTEHRHAHATGGPAGDAAELAAFYVCLGRAARMISISASKSARGLLRGASGVVEAIMGSLTMRDQTLPPTIYLGAPEFDGWDIVTDHARRLAGTAPAPERAGTARETGHERPIDTVLSTSFGFGGHHGALVLRRPSR